VLVREEEHSPARGSSWSWRGTLPVVGTAAKPFVFLVDASWCDLSISLLYGSVTPDEVLDGTSLAVLYFDLSRDDSTISTMFCRNGIPLR
jgi:hypothetical protein